ncbi:MarR family winged helix-turn-helix transcriptional regulator [Clostridium grantii]|uniref:DNA-binding transcriptional regulator, MarR family n=1 Tax=Clostridium grantii DSM 8605 TaxID=1121316 RepID=A0A1M5VMA5_9CLOT|nr:MarR family transcriptional regulator [Clostridium grantii]SHH76357.1 DNA-binding transcriptional regulator, MarR family [Clostridium grantii DSM 8605]
MDEKIKINIDIEKLVFKYIEEYKILFFPNQWSEIFLDFSKNEVFALLCLYRNKDSNMTDIAEYIMAPLNTTTGVVGRLEKKQLVERIRSTEDRRIVLITLTDKAKELIDKEKEIIIKYLSKIYESLTEDELASAFSIFGKVMNIFAKDKEEITNQSIKEKKVKKIFIE